MARLRPFWFALALLFSGSAFGFVPSTPANRDLGEWGVTFDGTTDNSAALAAAFAWATSTGGSLVCTGSGMPAIFATAISQTFSSATQAMSFSGNGQEQCILAYTGTGPAITINEISSFNSTHWADFTLTTNHAGTANGIQLAQTAATTVAYSPQSTFANVTFRDAAGFARGNTNYFGVAININGAVNYINFDGVMIQGAWPASGFAASGTGINLIGGTSTHIPVVYNFTNLNCNVIGVCLNIGPYVQGITMKSSNLVGGNIGINANSGGSIVGLTVVGSQFNEGNDDIFVGNTSGTEIANVVLQGNIFYVNPSGFGLGFLASQQNQIIGNQFIGTGASATGMSFGGSAGGTQSVIQGNDFENLQSGITLNASASGFLVKDNVFLTVTTDVNNSGTNNQVELGPVVTGASWTPVDASGGGNTFSAVDGEYSFSGNQVLGSFTATYPAAPTGGASPAYIGGFPRTPANRGGGNTAQTCYANTAAFGIYGVIPTNQALMAFFRSDTNGGLTNTAMANLIVRCNFRYPIN